MQLAFNNQFGLGAEGAATWLQTTLLAMLTVDAPPHCLVVGANNKDFPPPLRDVGHVVPVPQRQLTTSDASRLLRAVRRRVRRARWEDPALTQISKSCAIDLWVTFGDFVDLGVDRPLLAVVADFQYRHFPQMFQPGEPQGREHYWQFLADRADGILTLSETTRNDALSTRPDIRDRVFVGAFPPAFVAADLALDPEDVRRRYGLPEGFLLVSNRFWTHKNHRLILEAMRLRRARREHVPTVAFTGRLDDYRDREALSRLLQTIHRNGIHAECRLLGLLPRDEQVALIRSAAAVVQPSLFEGRGAIVEEASVLGTPVLCSDLPVHRELRAPRATFFAPDDPRQLAELMGEEYSHFPIPNEAVLDAVGGMLSTYGTEMMRICKTVIGRRGKSSV